MADWGMANFDRVGVEFRLISIPRGQEEGIVAASGYIDVAGAVGNHLTEDEVRDLVIAALQTPTPSVFIGDDVV